jgi:hypothetical protein
MTISVEAAPPGLTLWRDCDENVLDLPGVAAGQRAAQGDPTALAKELYDAGVRRVALDRPIDLAGATDAAPLVWAMILLRELTGWGVVVDWRLRPGTPRSGAGSTTCTRRPN